MMLKFYLITDTHYYDYEACGFSNHRDQVTWNESGPILDAVFDKLASKTDSDIVLIAGDLSCNGQTVCHEGFIKKLQRLKDSGKRIFVITASHDYGQAGFNATRATEPRKEVTCREELFDMYADYGFRDAIAHYAADPLSYVAQLAPGYRLLVLNTDGDRDFSELMNWAVAQLAQAKQDGQFLFAMHHYPVLSPSPVYPLLSPDGVLSYKVSGSAEQLADAGLRFVFTGHTHMQNITYEETAQGNRLYDINTGAAVGYPAPIRSVVIDDDNMTIETESIDSFEWDMQGKSVQQYLADHFDRMLNNIFEAANRDPKELLDILAGEFSVNKEALLKYKFFLRIGGKFLYKITFGGLGRLLFCRRKIDKSVRRLRLKDFVPEVVRNIYGGDEPYSRDTPVGAATYVILSRINKLAGRFLKGLPFESLQDFVASLLYDPTPDSNAVLPLRDESKAE